MNNLCMTQRSIIRKSLLAREPVSLYVLYLMLQLAK